MDRDLESRYRFFRAQGEAATHAICLARAEVFAQAHGWTWKAEPEEESYKDVYGDDPPPGTEFYCIIAQDDDGAPLGSVGFVDDDKGANPYWRVVAAELFDEAIGWGAYPARCTPRPFAACPGER